MGEEKANTEDVDFIYGMADDSVMDYPSMHSEETSQARPYLVKILRLSGQVHPDFEEASWLDILGGASDHCEASSDDEEQLKLKELLKRDDAEYNDEIGQGEERSVGDELLEENIGMEEVIEHRVNMLGEEGRENDDEVMLDTLL